MNPLKVAFKNKTRIKSDRDEAVNRLMEIFTTNFDRRRREMLEKKYSKKKS